MLKNYVPQYVPYMETEIYIKTRLSEYFPGIDSYMVDRRFHVEVIKACDKWLEDIGGIYE